MLRLGDVIAHIQASKRSVSISLDAKLGDGTVRYWESQGRQRLDSDKDASIVLSHSGLTWKYSPERGWENDPLAAGAFSPVTRMLDTRRLLSAHLDLQGEEQIAGRAAVKLLAEPRPGMLHLESAVWSLRQAAPFWIDTEHWVVLKSRRVEVLRVSFDEPLSEDLFNPPGATFDPPVPLESHFPHPVSADQARSMAGFQLMAPRLLPERTRLLTWMAADHPKSRQAGALYAVEPGAYRTITVHLWDRFDAPVDEQWEAVEVDGLRVERRQGGPEEMNLGRAMIIRDGIRAMVVSDLPLDLVTQMAASIQPI